MKPLRVAPWCAILFALVLCSPAAPASQVSVARDPYLQQVTSTSAIVVWTTTQAGQAEVRYQAPGGAVQSVAAQSAFFAASSTGLAFDYYQHVGRLTGLQPATTYQYDILLNGIDLNTQVDVVTTAPAKGSGTVTFVAFGDSGTGSPEQRQIASRLTADDFDFAVHGGDIAYGNSGGTGGATHQTMNDWFFAMYRDWLRARPMFPSMGNHDSRASNANGQPYLDVFELPRNGGNGAYTDHAERYYSFDYGPVHVVVLDTELAFQDLTRRDAQLAWLDADLAATNQPWKMAVFHRSPYSAGGEHGSDLAVRSAFTPLFDRYGVQLVISAHEHVYERTVALRGGQPDPSGTVYVVSGGGGGPLYPAGTASWTAYSAAVHHYVKGTASSCTLRLDAIAIDGRVIDGVTLDRCSTPPPSSGPTLGAGDILLYASDANVVAGNWVKQDDATAAGGRVMRNPDRGAAKKTTASAAPADYFELSFTAQPNVPYRLWMRGKAEGNVYYNDSAFVQFTGATNYAIGTTSAAEYNLEDCSGCGIAGWGWQDNGWGVGVLGPTITFTSPGPHRIRVQVREDGLSIDQILLSPDKFLSAAPGALKNDTTIYPRTAAPAPAPGPEPAPSLPAGWSTQDIGAVGQAGSASASSGIFTVEGAGADIWGSADAFRYVWQPVSGDIDIVARVRSVEYVHAWVKAGVMIREKLTADSPHALMLVSPGKGLAFQRRLAQGGVSTHTSGGGGTAPAWVKLSRRGNTITASRSADGVTWTVVGSDTFGMSANVYVGLAVSSHDSTQLATATFDSVSVAAATAPPPPPSAWSSQDIGAVGATGGSSSNSGAYSVMGAGADIWGTADAFHYLWQRASGDFDVTARVTSVEYVHAWVKAGVMIRAQLTPDSPHALMLVSPGKGLAFQRRVATGGISTHTSGGAGTAPAWVRLQRRGNTITAYRSADGANWTLVGSDTFTMAADVYVGLAVSSHVAGTLATATFDSVAVVAR